MEKNDIPINRPRKQARIAILISDKTDFKSIHVRRDRNGHYILTKEKINQKDNSILNIYAPNMRASEFEKKKKPTIA